MKDLKAGEKVLTMNDYGEAVYSEISMIMHRQTDVTIKDYVELKTEDGPFVILSSFHLIFISHSQAIFSKDVKLNQYLFTYNTSSKSFKKSRIIRIRNVTKSDAYAPLSMEGTIVVNDIYTSCYAVFPNHRVSHAVFSLWRNLHRYLRPISELIESNGEYHWYPNVLRTVVNWLKILPYVL